MNKLLNKLFEESKKEFFEILKNKNSKNLFEIIDKINVHENKEKELDSLNYSQVLYFIMIYYSNMDFNNITIRCGFNYIIDMIEFLKHVNWSINDDGEFYFLKIKSQFMLRNFITDVYTFSSRFYEYEEDVKNDFYKNSNDYTILSIERIKVDYENLFLILNEIIKNENWKYKFNKFSNNGWYEFDHKNAFNKYF